MAATRPPRTCRCNMSYDASLDGIMKQFMQSFQGGKLLPHEFDANNISQTQQDEAARATYRLSLSADGGTLLAYLFDLTINRAAYDGGNILEAVSRGLRRDGQNDIMGHLRLLILRGKTLEEQDDERRRATTGSP